MMNKAERQNSSSCKAGIILLMALVFSWQPVGVVLAQVQRGGADVVSDGVGVREETMAFLGQRVTVKRWTDREAEIRYTLAEFPGGTVLFDDNQRDGTMEIHIADLNGNAASGNLVCDGLLSQGGTCDMVLHGDTRSITVNFTRDGFTAPTGVLTVSGRFEFDRTEMMGMPVPEITSDAIPGIDSVAVDGVEMLRFSEAVPFSQMTEMTGSDEFGGLAIMLNVSGSNRSLAGAVIVGVLIGALYLIVDCLFLGWFCEVIPAWIPAERLKRRHTSSLAILMRGGGMEVHRVAA